MSGALTLDLGLDSHLSDALPISSDHLNLRLGYLRYIGAHGERALGLYLNGGWGIDGFDARLAESFRIGGGLKLRARFMNDAFHHIAYGAFIEGDAILLKDRPETRVGFDIHRPAANGYRLAAGVSFAPGTLVTLGPYVWGQLNSRLGYQRVQIGEIRSDAFLIGFSFDFDWGRRVSDRLGPER